MKFLIFLTMIMIVGCKSEDAAKAMQDEVGGNEIAKEKKFVKNIQNYYGNYKTNCEIEGNTSWKGVVQIFENANGIFLVYTQNEYAQGNFDCSGTPLGTLEAENQLFNYETQLTSSFNRLWFYNNQPGNNRELCEETTGSFYLTIDDVHRCIGLFNRFKHQDQIDFTEDLKLYDYQLIKT